MATENIMMDAVKRGGDRQALHERIRVHAVAAGKVVKEEGGQNDLIDRIAADPMFGLSKEEIVAHMNPSAYIGRCVQQVEEFDREVVEPIRSRYGALLTDEQPELKV